MISLILAVMSLQQMPSNQILGVEEIKPLIVIEESVAPAPCLLPLVAPLFVSDEVK